MRCVSIVSVLVRIVFSRSDPTCHSEVNLRDPVADTNPAVVTRCGLILVHVVVVHTYLGSVPLAGVGGEGGRTA